MSDIHPLFKTNKLNDIGVERTVYVRQDFDRLLKSIEIRCNTEQYGGSRELSLCKTKLEEACMFAIKAIAQVPEHQTE